MTRNHPLTQFVTSIGGGLTEGTKLIIPDTTKEQAETLIDTLATSLGWINRKKTERDEMTSVEFHDARSIFFPSIRSTSLVSFHIKIHASDISVEILSESLFQLLYDWGKNKHNVEQSVAALQSSFPSTQVDPHYVLPPPHSGLTSPFSVGILRLGAFLIAAISIVVLLGSLVGLSNVVLLLLSSAIATMFYFLRIKLLWKPMFREAHKTPKEFSSKIVLFLEKMFLFLSRS